MAPGDRGQCRPHGPPGQDANEQLPWSIVYYQAPDGTMRDYQRVRELGLEHQQNYPRRIAT